jgi:selenocysteine lyase/cysteine desulfurase
VAAHEADLTAYALERLGTLKGVEVLGDPDPARASQRLGVIPFNLTGVPHFLTAAILGYEFGIGVRNGCFCAHPYILHLLGLTPAETDRVRAEMLAHDRSEMPGLVRASFGLYNTRDEIDEFARALEAILRGEYRGRYHQHKASGDYVPEGWEPRFEAYFNL